ncbi:MAG: 16S rRNA (cytosine(1402)-N(4))-methyltransferase RsmH [Kiloniellales bacterium]
MGTGGRLDPKHRPVMLAEVLAALNPRAGAIYVDGTFGGGGYSRALLEAASCRVYGIDRDPAAIAGAEALIRAFPGRLTMIEGRYGEMDLLLRARGIESVDGVALDLGLSAIQLADAGRGFSFQNDGPLDMRMTPAGPSAADAVNRLDEPTLAGIIRRFGEERHARRIARAIVAARVERPITRTLELADIVRAAVPSGMGRRPRIDPATRTFQALRVYVNDELGELDRGLRAAETLLAAGGRLAVVSFHSLEDRIVKRFLRARSGAEPKASRHSPAARRDTPVPSFHLMSRRATPPKAAEVRANPRARSARLRAAERTSAPPWPLDWAA